MSDTKKNLAKEALLELDNIKKAIKEESKDTLKSLLAEAVKDAIRESVDDEDEYDVVDDDNTEDKETEEVTVDDSETSDAEGADGNEGEGETEPENTEEPEVEGDVDAQEAPEDGEGEEDDEWSEYGDYQVGDDTYDFTGVEDYDKLVKVYKLMKDDDTVVIKKDGGKIELKDNETGAEYVIDMDNDSDVDGSEGMAEGKVNEGIEDVADEYAGFGHEGEEQFELEPDFGLEDDYTSIDGDPVSSEETDFDAGLDDEFSNNNFYEGKKSKKVMKENKEMLFEVDLGYTDNYQDKDPISGLNNNEPSKSGKSWEKGVPTGTKKPWAGSSKDKGEPFEKTVNEGEVDECGAACGNEPVVDEATNVGGAVQQRSNSKSHIPANRKEHGPKPKRHVSTEGNYEEMVESLKKELAAEKKVNEAYKKENKFLKECIVKLKNGLNESRVTSLNMAKITKLFLENTVTHEEKVNIVNRFSNEAKTVEQSNQLYENIKKELNKKPETTLTENKQMTVNGTEKLNEEKTYKSKDLMNTLDLIKRVENI